MAKTKARKQRDKVMREKNYDVTIKRGNWNGVNPIERIKMDGKKYSRKRVSRYDDEYVS